jgi:hypothetical protein
LNSFTRQFSPITSRHFSRRHFANIAIAAAFDFRCRYVTLPLSILMLPPTSSFRLPRLTLLQIAPCQPALFSCGFAFVCYAACFAERAAFDDAAPLRWLASFD